MFIDFSQTLKLAPMFGVNSHVWEAIKHRLVDYPAVYFRKSLVIYRVQSISMLVHSSGLTVMLVTSFVDSCKYMSHCIAADFRHCRPLARACTIQESAMLASESHVRSWPS